MDELLTKLEAATEGSRELDAAIWFATQAAHVTSAVVRGFEDYGGVRREHWSAGSIGLWDDELPAYTSSRDAAATLETDGQVEIRTSLPGTKGHPFWMVTLTPKDLQAVYKGLGHVDAQRFHSVAKTEPLARCAAALKVYKKRGPC